MKKLINYFKQHKELWKRIIKCTIAYEIGTIIILIPKVSENVGVVPYLVTLGTLFFNASGTAGNQMVEMVLNVLVMLPAAIWCAIISYICTIYNSHIESQSLYSNGAGIIASIAFFISVFVTAYYRLKYPRLFIPALQGFVIPFFGLTKGIYNREFAVMSIVGIVYPSLIGGGIALLVNLIIWPETAAKVSENAFGSALASIQSVLESIEHDILDDATDNIPFGNLAGSKKLRQNIMKLDADISKMQSSRTEAKYEIVISYYRPTWYKGFAKTMDGLSRNLYGFSLAVEREGRIIQSQKIHDQLSRHRPTTTEADQSILRMRRQHQLQNGDTMMSQGSGYIALGTKKLEDGGTVSRIEYKYIAQLNLSVQPDIKQFIQISTQFMRSIRHLLENHDAIPKPHFHETSLCHDEDLTNAMDSLQRAKITLQKEHERRRAEPTEDHYLIYTVLFSLTQFGEKLIELEQEANRLIQKRHSGRFPTVFFPHVNLQRWLEKSSNDMANEPNATEQVLFEENFLQLEETRRTVREHNASETRTSTAVENKTDSSEEDEVDVRPSYGPNGTVDSRLSTESDWVDGNNTTIPLQNMPGAHAWNKCLYKLNEWFQTDPFRYAIKFTVTMQLLGLMAWLPIPGINEMYNNHHGQWALLSAMVVFNFTVGSTALQCLYRVLATIIGAVSGYICLLAGNRNQNPYVIAVMVLIFQIPMWYMLLGLKYPRIGFISLLTMAVIISTGYSDKLKEDLISPVWKRSLTAFIAIIVVLIVDNILWPVWARRKVRKHLADLLIDTGIQYAKVASLVCQSNTQSYRYRSTLRDAQISGKYLRRQHQLTSQMLGLAQLEPRITKSPFPISVYSDILAHEQNILYWIEHLLIAQTFISPHVRDLIMNPINSYRQELAAAVHLYLFTLAGSLRTKSSLPASLPSAEMARQILQQRQAQEWRDNFDVLLDKLTEGSEDDETDRQRRGAENQIYWQTYAAGSVEVIIEQEAIGDLVIKLMGQHVFRAATKDWLA